MIGRLRGRRSFRRLQEEGTRVRTRRLWCMMLLDPTAAETQVGYAIGRAVGPAVVRNRLRRRLRALLAQRAASLPHGFLLVGVQPSVAARAGTWTWPELGDAVDELLDRLAQAAPTTCEGRG